MKKKRFEKVVEIEGELSPWAVLALWIAVMGMVLCEDVYALAFMKIGFVLCLIGLVIEWFVNRTVYWEEI